ncbi:MAG TPA: Ig-like domain-containing protein [Verrucomicrobiae bacterium]|nr:Ig-like domain-containing protein [Verrucomicrobiae bacterium]
MTVKPDTDSVRGRTVAPYRVSRLWVLSRCAVLVFGFWWLGSAHAQLPPGPTTYCRAVLAKQSVTLHGNMLIDSFNSLDPAQSTNGQYDPAKRGDAGDVASAGVGVNVITDTGNTSIYGHLLTSPSGTVTISGSASVGSIPWVDGGSRGIQPGWYSNNLQVAVPDVTLPGVSFANLHQTSGVVNGTNYNYVLTTGNYKSSNFSLSGSMCINGNVVLYFQNGLSVSGQGFIYIAPGASLTVYLGGQSTLSGQGTINGTGFVTNCVYFGLPTCSSMQFSGGSQFIGTIYAPEAAVTLTGGGGQVSNFSGAVVANTVSLTGTYQFHFDQSLCGGCAGPVILVPPANQSLCLGETAYFYVNATGTALAYRWYKATSLLPGQTSNSLTLTNVQLADAGVYSVVVSGGCGTAQTNSASLTVNAPVLVVIPPANQTVCPGDAAQFSINAMGSALAYQWYKGASLLTGKTGNSLTLTNVQATDAAIYTVVVSGACGTAQTNSASLTVNSPVLVVTAPANQSVCPGGMAQFSINATGTALAYQWYKGASLLTGKTGSSLTLTNVQAADAAIYSVVVSGACGTAQTNSASLTVNSPVLVVTAPANQSVCPGGMAQFSINATGTALMYQWYKGPSLLVGQTGDSLNLTNVQATDAAIYSVVVSGACGIAQTNSASLVVNSQVLVVTPPANQTVCPGDTAQFSINATGTALVYQWYKGANLLTGQTGNRLTLTNVQATDAGIYSVVVSGVCGTAQTNSASLAVNSQVLVVTPPANQTVCPGDTAQFSINANGTALVYQWYKGANLLFNQTSSSLTLTNIQTSDGGAYSVVVSGACGTAQTNSASLTVNSPVLVVTAPANQSVCPGGMAQFSINATGTALMYQWYKGPSLLAGQTGNSLNLTNVQATDAAIYSVVVSGACGTAKTNSASLVVNSQVLVVTPPANQTVCPGDTAQFSINATGTALAYQWYKGANLLTGQTGNSLTLTNAQATDAAIYSVVVSGACGTAQTNSASLTVNSQVLVVTPPANQTVCPGDTAQFSINATGTALAYQWYKGASQLTGKTGSSLTLTNIQVTDAAIYSVVVSGACGTAQTNSASLTVNSPVLVVTAPANQSVCPGSTAQFAINATGTALTYQWYKGTNILTGQTGNTLVFSNAQPSDAAIYSVVVSGACGSAQTNSASLTVNSQVLVVTPPANQTVCSGDTAQFSINATGTALAYQWYKGANLLTGQTGNSLTLTNAQATDAAIYSVVVSGACGTAQTNGASLTVNSPVLVVTAPANQSVCPGGIAQFSINATGTALAYQWYKDANLLTGQTGNSLTLTNAQATDAAIYSVVVSGACGAAQTNSASLVVNSQVLVVTPPANQTVCPGDTALFSINATGSALTYQWYKGTNLLNSQTASSLTLTNVQATDASIYSVVISSACGTAQTNSASLTVNSPVLVGTAPANQSVCPGGTVQFSIDATGTTLAYQWYKGTSLLASQTGSTLVLSNVQSTDAAIYSVVVSGACGTAQTNTASLVVNSPVLVVTPPANQAACPGDTAEFNINASGTALVYQWFKGANLLPNQTSNTLTLTNVQATDSATYFVIVSGTCGAAQTNSASLTVNSPVLVLTAPANQSVCPDNMAQFSISATGTALVYQWYRGPNLLAGQTSNSLTLTNVQPADAAIYSVVVSGACGTAQTNTATLAVNSSTTATPLGGGIRNPGDSITFSTIPSGTGPFTFSWTKNGSTITGATGSSLTLTNLGYGDAGLYAVQVSGLCNSVTQSAALAINHPPTVTILSPTNGAVFLAPANFTVLADATDTDGVVTNVVFYLSGTNNLGYSTNAPYFVEQTNLPPGSYTYTAKAWDDMGLSATSAPVTISVQAHAPLSIVSAIHFDPQTGLFDQTVRVTNPTYSTFDAVRIYVGNLTNNAVLWNATGTTNGLSYVDSHAGVAPNSYVDFVLEYYVPSRITPNPTLTPVLIPPPQGGGVAVAGFQQHINRALMLPNKTYLIEFASLTNRLYYIEYTANLQLWNTAMPAIRGNGTRIQWIDNGQPKTDSSPAVTPQRFYRVILLP